MEPCTFIFVGISGCGKGTQIEKLKELLEGKQPKRHVNVLSTGEYFRALALQNKPFSAGLQSKIDGGNLGPDEAANSAVLSFLAKTLESDHLILDGYPRTLNQVEFLKEKLPEYRKGPVFIISYNVTEDTAIIRIFERAKTEKRGDNNIEAITSRLEYFKKDVAPVIDFYRSFEDYNFFEVDGEKSKLEVFEQIVENLKPFLN